MGLGARLFTFAVIADTHVNQEEGKASSDFAVNRLANARNRHVMHALTRARPAFVLHLGDIVHPTPGHPAYGEAAAAFHELASVLECPLHLTPGNHDVGDKPGDWLPVPSVNEEYLAAYRRHFGRNHFAFDERGCHFVVIDAQLVNSGLPAEAQQRRWLEEDLAAHDGGRVFLATHYPPFLLDPAEPGHYDNIDEPGRSWLLELLGRHRVEAVFAGHVHNFWYHVLGDTEFYLLPSTAFVRLDYSEMYRVEPGPERGRNDAPKLGFLLVDVHERGHVAHPVRTFGACLGPGEEPAAGETLPAVHARTVTRSAVGIDLRHPWAETVEIAASGALDEFARKSVRNDYPLMALWEMGIRKLRIPLADLLDPVTRQRMFALRRGGHEFTIYTHGVPPPGALDLLCRHAELIDAWEVIAPMAGVDAVARRIAAVRKRFPLGVRLSKLRRPDDALHHGDRARHVIEHGFLATEGGRIEAALRDVAGFREAFDGLVFRVSRTLAPWSELPRIAALASGLAIGAQAYVRLADDNPACAHDDELANANRVAEALFAAFALPSVGAWLDTFDDVDRGYFPRGGLVDRRFNPRMAGLACRHLNSALASLAQPPGAMEEAAIPGGRVLSLVSDAERLWLVLPAGECRVHRLPAGAPQLDPFGRAQRIDLGTGAIEPVGWTPARAQPQGAVLDAPFACAGPVLVRSVRG